MVVKHIRFLFVDSLFSQQVRHGHRIRGKPPTIARTLKQRLESLNQKDSEVSCQVNIGFAVSKISKHTIRTTWMDQLKANRSNPNIEKLARTKELSIDLEKVEEDWRSTCGSDQIHKIAEHYGIYKDLYGDAYFYPTLPLHIDYELPDNTLMRVYRGNMIKPKESHKPPIIDYNADSQSLWTLIMSTPDGNLENPEGEYCHWFIGNIPGNQVEKGEQLIDYLKPIPPRGIGYCRYIFVLYKQNQHIDYTGYRKEQPCFALKERDWKSLDFYRKHQDVLTPAGLAFFQADWDFTVKECYHNALQMKEPIFQYDFPKPYVKPQTWFPKRKPFNLYLDRYRDPKEISKEYLLKKLAKAHPFKSSEPRLKYPNAQPFSSDVPSWLRIEKTKERMGWGRINDIEE